MEFHRSWLIGVAACVAFQAFAQESAPVQPASPAAPVPATPAPPPPQATQSDVTKSAAPASDAKPTSASSPLEGELDAEKIMAAQRAGYQIKNENGQTLLCRRDLQTGSRVRYKTSCLTAREWAQLEEENKLQLKSMERKPLKVEGR